MDGQFQGLADPATRVAPAVGFQRPDNLADFCDHPNETRRMLDRAWVAASRLDAEAFFEALIRIEGRLGSPYSDPLPHWNEEAAVLRAIGFVWRDDAKAAAAVARGIGLHRGRHRSILKTVLRYAAWQQHNLAEFHDPRNCQRIRSSGPMSVIHLLQLSMQAASEAEQLRFKYAERLAKSAQKLAANDSPGPLYLLPTCVLAAIAYESGEADEADLLIRGRMASVERAGASESAILGFVVSARLAVDRGNDNVALMLLAQGERLAFQRGWSRLALRCASERIVMKVDRGDLDGAHTAEAAMVRALDASPLRLSDPAIDTWPLEVARCRIMVAEGQPERAAIAAGAVRNVARSRGQRWVATRLTVLLAGALIAAGDWATGLAELADALEEGASSGLFRTFVDEMGLIAAGLHRLREDPQAYRGHLAAYIDSLLRYEKPRSGSVRKKRVTVPGAIEALTDREVVVLRLMSLGLSNKEIARALDIMPETIKSHAKRIFVKLSAKARTEAVHRANELGIM